MHISIDSSDSTPIYEQLVSALKALINRGEIKTGDELPSVRQLAQDLGVNLNTVARAYRELARLGVLSVRQGRGVSVVGVKGRADEAARAELRKMAARLANEALFRGIRPEDVHQMIDSALKDLGEVGKP